jgi:hypothetical protein
MTVSWRTIWENRRSWPKAGLLILGAWITLYFAVIAPSRQRYSIASSKVAGLAAFDESPSYWRPSLLARIAANDQGASEYRMIAAAYLTGIPAGGGDNDAVTDRKMVRTASLELIVKSPTDSAEKIRTLAEHMGGYMVSSEMSGNQFGPDGAITVRVPASRFEEARAEIKKLGLRLESEKIEANDVTKDYVDKQARLRNLRAQEQQYLAILKRAATVKDTLEVSDKLNEVRGQIEQQQGEFEVLSRQVETVAISVLLHAESEPRVAGIHWRPLYELKVAAREGLDSLANYCVAIVAALFQLPAVALWFATIVLILAIAWRVVRWVWRTFFASPKSVVAERATT